MWREESRTVKALVTSLPLPAMCPFGINETHLPNDDFFFCLTAESVRTPALLQSVQCKYCQISEWSVPAVCDQWERGGNQPIITQQSFKNVLPKWFAWFFFCTSLFRKFSVTWPSPSFRLLPPHMWIRLSLCACHGLGVAVVVVCWTGCPHVSCRVHSAAPPSETLQTRLCFWFQPRPDETLKIFTWFLALWRFFCFFLEFKRSQFATVFQ